MAYPLSEITLVESPEIAEGGTGFSFSVTWVNVGGEGNIWYQAFDIDDPSTYLIKLRRRIAGNGGKVTADIWMPAKEPLRIRFEIGHEETIDSETTDVLDDSVDFTINQAYPEPEAELQPNALPLLLVMSLIILA